MSEPAPTGSRARWIAFAALTAVVVLATVGFVVMRVRKSRAQAELAASASSSARLPPGPKILVRDVRPTSTATFGKVALVPSRTGPTAERVTSELSCVRFHYANDHGLCLSEVLKAGGGALLQAFGPDLVPTTSIPMKILPSRVRISRGGKYGAITGFTSGDGYADLSMSTRTSLIDMASGTLIADLETFEVVDDTGAKVSAPDFNFWGVTFADDEDHFYATLATGKKTYLVHGSVSERRMTRLVENVECPSLSPDSSKIAFKMRTGGPGEWRLSILDPKTFERRTLARETRSIDDQVEWLDEGHILYKHGHDLWSLAVDDSSKPEVYLERASSVAIVRE